MNRRIKFRPHLNIFSQRRRPWFVLLVLIEYYLTELMIFGDMYVFCFRFSIFQIHICVVYGELRFKVINDKTDKESYIFLLSLLSLKFVKKNIIT